MRLYPHTREPALGSRLPALRRGRNEAAQPAKPLWLGSACRNVAVCLCAFALTAVALRPLTSAETQPLAVAKLEGFLLDKDAYDIVAVGNSRIYREIAPRVLESELALHGLEMRAYNLGAPSMSFDELAYLLGEIAAARPERLRWVLIDLGVELAFAAETTDVFQLLVQAGAGRGAFDYSARSLQYRFNRFANRAEGPAILRQLRWALRGQAPPLRLPSDGFKPLDDERLPEYAARRHRMLESLAEYHGHVERLKQKRGVLAAYSRRQAGLMEQLAGTVQRAGAEPIFLMPPSFGPARFFADPERYRVLAYHDPGRFPQLFELANRYDMGHLNRAGAEIFTRQVANDLVSTLESVGS